MIVGDRETFAIESSITVVSASLGQRALGYFVIYVRGRQYGVSEPDASMLGCSFAEVNERIERRGSHRIPFLSDIDASLIAEAFLQANFNESARNDFFGLPASEFVGVVSSSKIQWAPDGDAAFDDGSYILQFDIENKVRLIAFQNSDYSDDHASTVDEAWLDSDTFYGVLLSWRDLFAADWSNEIGKFTKRN